MRLSKLGEKRRILLMLICFIAASVMLWVRLFLLQVVRAEELGTKALSQRLRPIPVDGARGDILDRNGILLAGSEELASVYAIPAEVPDKEKKRGAIGKSLGLRARGSFGETPKRAAAVWLKKRITKEEELQIRELGIRGIGVVEAPKRVYPYGSLAAHVIGISGIDNQGLEGLELVYDRYLTGERGSFMVERDASGREVPGATKVYEEPKKGKTLRLTIDASFQAIAEKALAKRIEETQATSGLVIFVDVTNGEILAMASWPTFDPENYQDYPQANRRNIAVTDLYEPGSTFKIVTAAAAIEEGIATVSRRFFDPGYIVVSGWRVRCWRAGGHGSQNLTEALENSCNIAFATLGMELGSKLINYAKKYGFGKKTGIDFPGEATGILYSPGPDVPFSDLGEHRLWSIDQHHASPACELCSSGRQRWCSVRSPSGQGNRGRRGFRTQGNQNLGRSHSGNTKRNDVFRCGKRVRQDGADGRLHCRRQDRYCSDGGRWPLQPHLSDSVVCGHCTSRKSCNRRDNRHP